MTIMGGYQSSSEAAKFRRCRSWRGGRAVEGGGLLNRYRALKPYRGFESLPLRHYLRDAVRTIAGRRERAAALCPIPSTLGAGGAAICTSKWIKYSLNIGQCPVVAAMQEDK